MPGAQLVFRWCSRKQSKIAVAGVKCRHTEQDVTGKGMCGAGMQNIDGV